MNIKIRTLLSRFIQGVYQKILYSGVLAKKKKKKTFIQMAMVGCGRIYPNPSQPNFFMKVEKEDFFKKKKLEIKENEENWIGNKK